MINNIEKFKNGKTIEKLLKENIKAIKEETEKRNNAEPHGFMSDNEFGKYLDYKYNDIKQPLFESITTETIEFDITSSKKNMFKALFEYYSEKSPQDKELIDSLDRELLMSSKSDYMCYALKYCVRKYPNHIYREDNKFKIFFSHWLKELARKKYGTGIRISNILEITLNTRDIDLFSDSCFDYKKMYILNAVLAISDESSFLAFLEPDEVTNGFVQFEEPFKVNLLMAWRELRGIGKVKYIDNNLKEDSDGFSIDRIKVRRTKNI